MNKKQQHHKIDVDQFITEQSENHRLKLQIKQFRDAQARLLEELKIRKDQLDYSFALKTAPRFNIKSRARKGQKPSRREATGVLLASDLHLEEHVDPKTVNGLNEYNPTIARACMSRMAEAFCWLIRDNRFDVHDVILWLGGDLISGFIHEELMEGNFMSPLEATLFAQEMSEFLIDYVLKETDVECIKVPCNYGNHSRTSKKPRIATGAANSLEWLMYHSLARRYLKEPRVSFQIAEGEHLYMKAYDFDLRFQHGDAVRYAGGVGGLMIPINKAIAKWQTIQHADIDHFGHWHQYMDVPGIVMNGSMIGWNAYALHIKASYEPRAQAFYLLDAKRGKCQSTPIWFEGSKPL